MKRLLYRGLALFLLVLLGVFLFVYGRTYTLILDNGTVEREGRTIAPPAMAELVLDGGKRIEIFARDRVKAEVKGPRHRLQIQVMNRGGQVLSTGEIRFKLKGRSIYEVLLAPLAAGEGNFLREFSPAAPEAEPARETPAEGGPSSSDIEASLPAGAEIPIP